MSQSHKQGGIMFADRTFESLLFAVVQTVMLAWTVLVAAQMLVTV